MYKRLYQFLDSFEILYPLQFGFQEKHSISHALLCLTETIKHSIDNGRIGCGVFLDLQKAFDTVNHRIYGIMGALLSIMGYKVMF